MQPCTRNGSSEPGPPGTLGGHPPAGHMRYGARCLHRRNENGLLAVVERYRNEVRRNAPVPPPAEPGRT